MLNNVKGTSIFVYLVNVIIVLANSIFAKYSGT